MTIRDLILQSCQEINAAQSGQAIQPDVLTQGLLYLNMILDSFNATERKLYADLFSTYAIPITGNPITIGPTGTWAYPIARPNAIPAASVILAGTVPVYIPLVPMTPQQWQGLSVPTLASSLPNRFFYNPTSPNGQFNFWTVEDTAYSVQLQTRQMLSQVLVGTTFAQPPGYWYALMMLLARKLSSPLRKPWSQNQAQELTEAITAAFGNNGPDLLLSLNDWGMPSAGGTSGGVQDFNFKDGSLTGR